MSEPLQNIHEWGLTSVWATKFRVEAERLKQMRREARGHFLTTDPIIMQAMIDSFEGTWIDLEWQMAIFERDHPEEFDGS